MTSVQTIPPLSIDTRWLQASGWERFEGLVHGFSSRLTTHPSTLSPSATNATHLYMLKQVHGDEILNVQRQTIWVERPEADGMVTATPDALLGIATADCVPVLIVAPGQRVAAAVHAGWRGTLKGITARAIEMLKTQWGLDSSELWVALGPSVGGCCYEVGQEVGEAIVQRWGQSAGWVRRGEKGMLDLRAINAAQCERQGVPAGQVQWVGPCTFCENMRFASYRREGAGAGRQLSVIGWQAPSRTQHATRDT